MAFVEREASSSAHKFEASGRAKKAGFQNFKKDGKAKVKSNQIKRQRADEELTQLQKAIDDFDAKEQVETFSELPLSTRTQKGLKSCHFMTPTAIQALAIPPSLKARDVLGSAKTGSGKTLAFLIPMLERLYMLKWGPMDGLGAVVISPTRELAVQTFNQLRDIGKYHSFSAGLVIGGKPLKEERDRLSRMNILIATPGRLLQHLDSTIGFESSGVQVLVLDEADRLLDLGFLPALRAIVSHFTIPSSDPTKGRQTLLYSATQSSDLASLAKLSLKDPLYINCNKAGEEGVVPSNLEQYYSVVGLEKKLDALWGFVKSHLKMKGVVFVTSGKQVRFVFEAFRRLHPGLPLMHLHGKQKQPTRLSIFQKFSSSKSALLICTDVAARGLDFPSVDWVIQLDCPDDVDTYIHRVGRTARYQSGGKALCFLCPSEEAGMVKRWEGKGLDVKNIKIKSSKMGDLRQQLQNFAFKEPEIKYLAQRAFVSYMRSVHFQKDKSIFDLSELPSEEFAASLGLAGAPQIRLADTSSKIKTKGKTAGQIPTGDTEAPSKGRDKVMEVVGSSDESGGEGDESDAVLEADVIENDDLSPEISGVSDEDEEITVKSKAQAVRTKYDRMFERRNQSILTPHYSSLVAQDDGDDDDDVFTLSRQNHALPAELADDSIDGPTLYDAIDDKAGTPNTAAQIKDSAAGSISAEDLSKRKLKAGQSAKGRLKSRPAPEKVIFDDDGNMVQFYQEGQDAELGAGDVEKRKAYLDAESKKMREADKVDREVAREAKREKKRKRKEREKEVLMGDDDNQDGPALAYIGTPSGDDGDDTRAMSDGDDLPPANVKKAKRREPENLEDEEALALRLLQG